MNFIKSDILFSIEIIDFSKQYTLAPEFQEAVKKVRLFLALKLRSLPNSYS
jgi:hypothetical protein